MNMLLSQGSRLDVKDDPRVLREVGRVATPREHLLAVVDHLGRRHRPGPARRREAELAGVAERHLARAGHRRQAVVGIGRTDVGREAKRFPRRASREPRRGPPARRRVRGETAGDGAMRGRRRRRASIDGAVEGAGGDATADEEGDAVSGAAALHEARASARPSTVAAIRSWRIGSSQRVRRAKVTRPPPERRRYLSRVRRSPSPSCFASAG